MATTPVPPSKTRLEKVREALTPAYKAMTTKKAGLFTVLALGTHIGLPAYLALRFTQPVLTKGGALTAKHYRGVKDFISQPAAVKGDSDDVLKTKARQRVARRSLVGVAATALLVGTTWGVGKAADYVAETLHMNNPNVNSLVHYGIGGHFGNAVVQAAYDSKTDRMGFMESFLRRSWHKTSDVAVTTAVKAVDTTVNTTIAARDGLAGLADPNDVSGITTPTVLICANTGDFRDSETGKPHPHALEDQKKGVISAYYAKVNAAVDTMKTDSTSKIRTTLDTGHSVKLVIPGYKHDLKDMTIKAFDGKESCEDKADIVDVFPADQWLSAKGYKPTLK